MITSAKAPSRLLLVGAFLSIYIIWGTTYLAILYGLQGFPPFILSAFRFLLAGSILLGWGWYRGHRMPRGKDGYTCSASGILMLVGGSGLVTFGEQYISSGQTAIIMATEPFLFLLMDRKNRKEYFSSKIVIGGLIIGFTGIVLFFRFAVGVSTEHEPLMQWVGHTVVLLSAVLWVVGSLFINNRLEPGRYNGGVVSGVQLLAAGAGCLLITVFTREWQGFSLPAVPAAAWWGFFYLVVMGSLVAYLAFTWLITIMPPAIVSTHTYINPVVAVFVGWLMMNEHISRMQGLALLIILAGLLLTNIPAYRRLGIIRT